MGSPLPERGHRIDWPPSKMTRKQFGAAHCLTAEDLFAPATRDKDDRAAKNFSLESFMALPYTALKALIMVSRLIHIR